MTIQGNVAVECEMQRLLNLMDEIKDKPPQQQLEELRKHIEQTIKSAEGGWL